MDKVPEFKNIKTYPIRERKNKVRKEDFANGIPKKGISFCEFINGLPNILIGKDLREIAKSIVKSRKENKPVIFCIGAHVIKCGLNPVLIELIKKDIITCIAMNGAGAIHDFEVAMIGETSEDVPTGLEDGTFGMVEETGKLMNEALIEGAKQGLGAGKTLGEKILKEDFPYRELSLLNAGIEYNIPITVHIAVGTDIIHQHPSADGSSIGETSFTDFKIFVNQVASLEGGFIGNFGSMVILPEIFLKALTIVRNLEYKVENFTAANFDMIKAYRPTVNVVQRPTSKGGKGYTIIGHHEIMIPLLAQTILELY